jgi:hypothetical protein
MPAVRNTKSRAKDSYEGAWKGRGRRASTICSWFVLIIGIAMGACLKVGIDLQTVICNEPSVSRESGAATKLNHPADASLTIWWCPFKQA